jgi:WD40 repeat protein
MIQKDSKPLVGVRRDPVKTFEGLEHHILAIAMFPDGERIATGSGDKAIRIWRIEDRKEMKKWVMEKIIGALAILKDGRRVVSSEGPELGGDEILSYQWQLWVRDAQTGRVMAGPLDGHTHQVLTLDVSPEGGILASGSYDCTVILWDTSTWQRKGDPLLCGAFVTCVQFSRSSSHLGVTTAEDIQIWDLDRRVCLAQFKGHAAYNKTWNKWLTWTRDGAHLFSAGAFNDPVIRCWDTTTSKQAGDAWTGHHYDIFQIVLNPADTLLASASDDHTVRLWQVPTGTEVARYNHSHVILHVAFSVNGPFLYSGGEDKRISQRQIPVEVLAAARRAQKTEVTMPNWYFCSEAHARSFQGGPSRSKPKARIYTPQFRYILT